MHSQVCTCHRLHHDREEDPRADLVRVVRARDELEEERERVAGGERNLALFAAGRTQVAQRQMDRQVAQLIQLQKQNKIHPLSIQIDFTVIAIFTMNPARPM